MAFHWNFDTTVDKMIRAQLAEHTNYTYVRENLPILLDDLTLTQAVDIIFYIEAAVVLTSQIATPPP